MMVKKLLDSSVFIYTLGAIVYGRSESSVDGGGASGHAVAKKWLKG
jgi:hypothetical protein